MSTDKKSQMKKSAGFSDDRQIDALEDKLSDLAYEWRSSKDSHFVAEYQETVFKLLELGWRGTLDVDSMLPEELMPEIYFRRKELPADFRRQPEAPN